MAERLQKFLAKSGIGSRRFCETLIKSKRIKINGVIAEIGVSVTKNDFIEFDGKEIQYKESEIKLLILNKPCLLYTSPSPRDGLLSRMPSSA